MTPDFLAGAALGLLAGWASRWSRRGEDTTHLAECAAKARLIEIHRERPCADPEMVKRIRERV